MRNHSISSTLRALAAFIFLALGFSAAAQAQPFDIPWYTIDGGGGTSSGGTFTLSGTIGQPDAGNMSGGTFELKGGFWPGGATPVLACNLADIVGISGTPPPDGRLGGEDFLQFMAAFFGGTPLADVVGAAGTPPPDGHLGGEDFLQFLGAFFGGC